MLGQHRSAQRKVPRGRPDEEALTADIIALASQCGRYGYRRITALLWEAGWAVNVKRVERIWRREGLRTGSTSSYRGNSRRQAELRWGAGAAYIKSAVFSVSGPGVVIENGREHDFDDIEDAIALHLENMGRLGK